jgi:hypothetical protein
MDFVVAQNLHFLGFLQGRAGCMSYVAGFLTFMSIGGFPSFVEDMKVHGFGPIAKTPKEISFGLLPKPATQDFI